VPEPILISIAAALATKAIPALYDFVKGKFAGKPAAAALEKAEGATPGSPEIAVLAEELAKAERADPGFGTDLRQVWQSVHQQAGGDAIANVGGNVTTNTVHNSGPVNTVSGNVTGKVIQAGDIHGNITFG
jgi:hypothetical protein